MKKYSSSISDGLRTGKISWTASASEASAGTIAADESLEGVVPHKVLITVDSKPVQRQPPPAPKASVPKGPIFKETTITSTSVPVADISASVAIADISDRADRTTTCNCKRKCCREPIVIEGPEGPQGPSGKPGRDGCDGERGPQGEQGPPGATGARGPKGRGSTGQAGPQGNQGPRGKDGCPGATGPTGQAGQKGDKGDKGDPGRDGCKGECGQCGATGCTGERGCTGATGPRGCDGCPGATGATGARGPKGEQGPPGEPCRCHDRCYETNSESVRFITGGGVRNIDVKDEIVVIDSATSTTIILPESPKFTIPDDEDYYANKRMITFMSTKGSHTIKPDRPESKINTFLSSMIIGPKIGGSGSGITRIVFIADGRGGWVAA